ncbi:MAG: hypothetical protein IH819_11100 [Bacteroidetes bacterium]|nr:hypothetical protein [Bacteroidota bacterium]
MSLPNKLFDYIKAGIPILSSDLIEVKGIVKKYEIGEIANSHDPIHIAEKINYMIADDQRYIRWKQNLKSAANELCWEKEQEELIKLYKKVV